MDSLKTFPNFNLLDSVESISKMGAIIDAAEKLGGNTTTSIDELAVLFELARGWGYKIPSKGFCVETGTHYGVSALAMALGVRESHLDQFVLTIDHYLGTDNCDSENPVTGKNRPQIVRNLAHQFNIEHFVCQCIHNSLNFLRQIKLPVRLAFIDSAHDFTTPYKEATFIMEMLMPDGWVVFHDYGLNLPQVIDAVHAFIKKQKPSMIEVFSFGGMCIVHKLANNANG